jgi:hypothetical protein
MLARSGFSARAASFEALASRGHVTPPRDVSWARG